MLPSPSLRWRASGVWRADAGSSTDLRELAQLAERLFLQLADALARQVVALAYLLERLLGALVVVVGRDPEARRQDVLVVGRQLAEQLVGQRVLLVALHGD